MRIAPATTLFTTFLTIFSIFSQSTSVLAKSLVPTRNVGGQSPALRQRGLDLSVDICVELHLDILIDLKILVNILKLVGLDVDSLSGVLDVCVCLSTAASLVQDNPDLKAIANAMGRNGKKDLTNMIKKRIKESSHSCDCPENAYPTCSIGGSCDFECKIEDGYVKQGDKCVCPPPKRECNGKCQDNCPSAIPRRLSRSLRALCAESHTACPMYSRWECVDTRTDLENCGGCILQMPGYRLPHGQDCTEVPHVQDVACRSGQCVVQKCDSGFIPNPERTKCTPVTTHHPSSHHTTAVSTANLVGLLPGSDVAVIREGLASVIGSHVKDGDVLGSVAASGYTVEDLRRWDTVLEGMSKGFIRASSSRDTDSIQNHIASNRHRNASKGDLLYLLRFIEIVLKQMSQVTGESNAAIIQASSLLASLDATGFTALEQEFHELPVIRNGRVVSAGTNY
ncbi:hypothetical protein FRC03_000219 [Tulasnella sp. 419]|nr:hypothetical protein FRC03_000219 [Tulasnella sp. 419]